MNMKRCGQIWQDQWEVGYFCMCYTQKCDFLLLAVFREASGAFPTIYGTFVNAKWKLVYLMRKTPIIINSAKSTEKICFDFALQKSQILANHTSLEYNNGV